MARLFYRRVVRFLIVLLAACGGSSAGGPDGGLGDDDAPTGGSDAAVGQCTRCPMPGEVENRGPAPSKLVEASGIVASRAHPGVLYSHNDSGDAARVFAFDDHGVEIATLTITGATNMDWEDIAIGPCGATSCLYIGDIGDNGGNRATKTVYRIPEPDLAPGMGPMTMALSGVEALPFSYPIGIDFFHNAETLLVHPQSGDIYVVTKEDAGTPSVVFKFPQPVTPGQTATMERLATLPFPSGNEPDVSGGDIDPCGTSVLLRLGSAKLYELDVAAGQPFDSVFSQAGPLRTLPIALEGNGESITWDATGAGYFTISEGANAQLHRIACP
jgi:hypothetical protein